MFNFLTLTPEIFGMDISDGSLRVAKLKKARKGFKVSYVGQVELAEGVVKEGVIQDPQALSKAIKEVCGVRGKKVGAKHVALSLPEKKSFFQVISMPKMSQEELELAVPIEAENYIPLPIEKVYVDFQIIAGQDGASPTMDILISGMQKPIIDSYVSCIKSAGFTPVIMEIESQAIVRSLMLEGAESPPVICLDIGRDNTIFTIFSANSIRFTTSLPISSQQFTSAIAAKLDIPLEKAEKLKVKYGLASKGDAKYHITTTCKPIILELATQIKKYISFYQGHLSGNQSSDSLGHIHKIIVCGGGANIKKLSEALSKELHIPVEIGNPLVNIVKTSSGKKYISQENALSFTTALGLALRGASEYISKNP